MRDAPALGLRRWCSTSADATRATATTTEPYIDARLHTRGPCELNEDSLSRGVEQRLRTNSGDRNDEQRRRRGVVRPSRDRDSFESRVRASRGSAGGRRLLDGCGPCRARADAEVVRARLARPTTTRGARRAPNLCGRRRVY